MSARFASVSFVGFGYKSEGFFALGAAATGSTRAIKAETNHTRSVLAMRAKESDHATNLPQLNQRGKAHSRQDSNARARESPYQVL